jgi:hypothetical protein
LYFFQIVSDERRAAFGTACEREPLATGSDVTQALVGRAVFVCGGRSTRTSVIDAAQLSP